MWFNWLPWRFIIKRAAKAHGFLDPLWIMSTANRFAQPAEVIAPLELLRAGVIFHARGFINSQAIQHNLDWVWPYWVNCQFNPKKKSFVPRAFSLTHINLTHRNWTAVGLPDSEELPIVDPRGLLTPFWDSWSLDVWMVDETGKIFIPAKLDNVDQVLNIKDNLSITTTSSLDKMKISTIIEVFRQHETHVCQMMIKAQGKKNHKLVVSLRPYNPEGISFIHKIKLLEDKRSWLVEGKRLIVFNEVIPQNIFSYYRKGDVSQKLLSKPNGEDQDSTYCNVGMATAAAIFSLNEDGTKEVCVHVPLFKDQTRKESVYFSYTSSKEDWQRVLEGTSQLNVSDERIQFLFDAAIKTIILHSVDDIYPGPYTYKRFWFRDSVIILYAMLSLGLKERAWKHIQKFPKRQTPLGYFNSQDGEWDSNGQVLWVLYQYFKFSQQTPDSRWKDIIRKSANWIGRKRVSQSVKVMHAGLMKAGFSAEHLGPNDYFYWDNFWSVAGLQSASKLMNMVGDEKLSQEYKRQADDLMGCVNASLIEVEKRLQTKALPSSPYRRLDSGSVGSIVVGYPLQLWDKDDKRLLSTADYLYENCLVEGGLFHDVSHSGMNPYLTLHLAQVYLRAGDSRFMNLIDSIAKLASPTGQWPEAIHPITKGGCMGDGQHVWAAAEWIVMIRNCFVREEKNKLILCSGIFPQWYTDFSKNNETLLKSVSRHPFPDSMDSISCTDVNNQQKNISLENVLTEFGKISVWFKPEKEKIVVQWQGDWHKEKPIIEISIPGFPVRVINDQRSQEEFLRK